MGTAHSLIYRNYLNQMTAGEIIPLDDDEKSKPHEEKIRLFRVKSIVYDKFENINEKLNSLFCALSIIQDCNLVMFLNNSISDNDETQEFYIGVSGNSVERTLEASKILEQSLSGNFPGCDLENCLKEDLQTLLPDLVYKTAEEPCSVSCVSVDAVDRSGDKNFVQGMEKFADGMRGRPYTLMVVASPVVGHELQNRINAYRDLYTQLSPYKVTNQTITESRGSATTISVGTQMGQTISRARTVSKSRGTSDSISDGKNISQTKKDVTGSLIDIGSILLGVLGGAALDAPALNMLGFAYGGRLIGTHIRDFMNHSPQQEVQTNQHTHGTNYQESISDQESDARQKSEHKDLAINDNESKSVSLQRSVENKPVIDMLNSIDHQIQKMSAALGQGAYNVAAYVISADKIISESGAGLYSSLLSGGRPDNITAINTWKETNSVDSMQDYLVRGLNPAIKLSKTGAFSRIDSTTFVPCNEMPLHFFFPRKSLPGLPILERAEFARSMPCQVDKDAPQINLGKVFHLGREEKNSISLPRDILCSHTCLVGAPGSGKSNMSYHLLSQLIDANINFMVIEPAKGEYAQVLGGRLGVECLSTEINVPNFFSINPFAFPKGCKATAHADALVSLLTTCWEMYAAMSEILKDAVLQVYEDSGWNMSDQGLPWEEDNYRFPTFKDLLKVLPEIIDKSDYSNEVKGNYKGALEKRLKPLTEGTNGKIFRYDCRNDEDLFNQKVIVDLSSIRSDETSALLMGLLIIRLDEFRTVEKDTEGINRPLHHVTLLEEAHNLLSASHAQSAKSVGAKFIKLFNKAIAEMRSYGEGFIIVDQTPSKLDSSVISDTITKIVFNLPNKTDSSPMGNAMSLNADQESDLSVLPCGVCVVRSRGWNAPVQLKVPLFPKSEYKPYKPPKFDVVEQDLPAIRGKMLTAFLRNDQAQVESLADELRMDDRGLLLLKALDILKTGRDLSTTEHAELYKEFFNTHRWLKAPTKENLSAWDANARKQLNRRARLESVEQDRIIQILLLSVLKPNTKSLFDAWLTLKNSRQENP